MVHKILRYFAYSITIFFLPIFVVVIFLLRNFVIIRFLSVPTNRIGHFAGNIEMYLSKKKNNNTEKYYDIAFYQKYISNKFLAKMWRRKLNVYPNYFVFPLYFFFKFFSKYFAFMKKHICVTPSFESRDCDNILDNMSPQIEFEKKEIEQGFKQLKDFGLDESSKFVCFIIRDQEYLKKIYPKNDWSYWGYRDYDVEDFYLAAEELTKLGYYVFRMGKITGKKFKTNNKMIIDYSKSEFRNDFLDIFLGANCEFCLSTDVGFDHVPYIFRRPLASITDPISLIKFSSKKFLSIFSNYYCQKQKKNLSVSEIFKRDVAYFSNSRDLEKRNIKLVKPDRNQIKDLVLDMVNYINDDFKLDNSCEYLSKKFINVYKKNINSNKFISDLNSKLKKSQQYQNIKLHSEYFGKISPSFLEKNKHLYT